MQKNLGSDDEEVVEVFAIVAKSDAMLVQYGAHFSIMGSNVSNDHQATIFVSINHINDPNNLPHNAILSRVTSLHRWFFCMVLIAPMAHHLGSFIQSERGGRDYAFKLLHISWPSGFE